MTRSTCPAPERHTVADDAADNLAGKRRSNLATAFANNGASDCMISNQARFPREQITFAGKSAAWTRTAESGNRLTFHFCPTCGSTVYWKGQGFPGFIAVAIGAFADPNFAAPTISVWEEESRHPWVTLPHDTPPKRIPKQG